MTKAIHNLQNAAKAHVHKTLRRFLSQETRATMKKWQGQARKRASKLLPLLHGAYTSKDLIANLESRITGDFEILMVHSAFDHLQPMYTGNALELVKSLIEFCGKDRTLVMPAFVLGGKLYDKSAYFSTHNFDIKRTPSEMGMVTELFRRMPGVVRSLHPTHSVCALGPLAKQLTAGHHAVPTRTGKGTPFEFMNHHETVIVGLGIEYFRCLTHVLTAIDILDDQYPVALHRDPIPATMIDETGTKIPYDVVIPTGATPPDNTLLRSLLSDDELKEWTFHGTTMFATRAAIVTERLIAAAKCGVTAYGKVSPSH